MPDWGALGKVLILTGLGIAALGFVLVLAGKIPWLGRLPGDFLFRGRNVTVFFPLMTCLIVSVVLSLIFWFIGRR